jgi:hypothetical protein
VLKYRHLTTVENRLADLLSRWDLHSTISEEFLNHAQNNAWSEVVVEDKNCHNKFQIGVVHTKADIYALF